MHNAHSGPPVGCGGGEGDPARARAWRRVGCGGRSVPAEQLWPLFFLIHPSEWEADWRRSVLPFPVVGSLPRRFAHKVAARRADRGDQAPRRLAARLSREFIGDSLPVATVEDARGARRPLPSLQSESFFTAAGFVLSYPRAAFIRIQLRSGSSSRTILG